VHVLLCVCKSMCLLLSTCFVRVLLHVKNLELGLSRSNLSLLLGDF
jgi:hypothetical protein